VSSCFFPHVLERSFCCCCFHRLLPFLTGAVLVGSNHAIAAVSTTTVCEHHCEHSTQETKRERERVLLLFICLSLSKKIIVSLFPCKRLCIHNVCRCAETEVVVTSRRGLVGFVAAGEERKARERVTGTKVTENIVFPFFLRIFIAGKKNKDLGGGRERHRSLAPLCFRGFAASCLALSHACRERQQGRCKSLLSSLQNAYCISLACLSFTLYSLALTNAFSRFFPFFICLVCRLAYVCVFRSCSYFLSRMFSNFPSLLPPSLFAIHDLYEPLPVRVRAYTGRKEL
jgi:hypothetical protein